MLCHALKYDAFPSLIVWLAHYQSVGIYAQPPLRVSEITVVHMAGPDFAYHGKC